ncbi:hypothetical protein [Stenotrophomonas maltophilia]|uniref:hypothetical protein n=1 Tax=Stenotrophomonas maltophilia TaxID=40324 RepID=UPI000B26AAD6|nr:hypothetical protein [Stenotrophomonas maltophilia]
MARMFVASVSQIRANDVTNPLWPQHYNALWMAKVTVQLFCRSEEGIGLACSGHGSAWPFPIDTFLRH